MKRQRNPDSIVSCLLRQGFSLPEAVKYLRNFQQESKALRNTHLFISNGGIKRIPKKEP